MSTAPATPSPAKSNQSATMRPVTFADELLGVMAATVRLMAHRDAPGSSIIELNGAYSRLAAVSIDVEMSMLQSIELNRIHANAIQIRKNGGIGR